MAKAEKTNFDEHLIRKLASLLDDTGLAEIEYEKNGLKVRVAKPKNIPTHSAEKQTTAHKTPPQTEILDQQTNDRPNASAQPGTITAPMVGIAYLSPDAESPQFVAVGDKVVTNQTVLLIEAMKVFNQIKAIKNGTVRQIFVENGSPVEFGEPLIVID